MPPVYNRSITLNTELKISIKMLPISYSVKKYFLKNLIKYHMFYFYFVYKINI